MMGSCRKVLMSNCVLSMVNMTSFLTTVVLFFLVYGFVYFVWNKCVHHILPLLYYCRYCVL